MMPDETNGAFSPDKAALMRSAAGRRLIAHLTIVNTGDGVRLRQYVRDNYHADALTADGIAVRLAAFRLMRAGGRVRVKQVIASDDHQVAALLAREDDALWAVQMVVGADHPHLITAFALDAIAAS